MFNCLGECTIVWCVKVQLFGMNIWYVKVWLFEDECVVCECAVVWDE